MAGTRAGQHKVEGLGGDITLGIDNNDIYQVMPSERTQLRTFEDLRVLDLLDSIDSSLKTLLDYMKEIVGDKLG